MGYRGRIGWLVLAFVGFFRSATAAQWVVAGTLGQHLRYDDNISFSTIQKQPVFGYLLTPIVTASRKTGSLELVFEGQGDIRRYDDSRWDCDNYASGFNGRYSTKRSIFAVSGGYGYSCSYIRQLEDTGILVPTTRYENYTLAPSWTWQWTERTQLIAETSYSNTSYIKSRRGTEAINFQGNDTYSLRLGGNHLWSRRLSLNGGVFFSNIVYTNGSLPNQNLFGFQAGANYAISRKWKASAGGGLRWLDTERNTSTALDYIANLSLSYEGPLTNFSIGYSNSINPSAIGQTQQYQTVFANYSYRFAPHLSLSVAGNFSRNSSFDGQSSGNSTDTLDRDYLNVSAGLVWQFAKNWEIKGSYEYRWQQYRQDIGNGESNTVTLSLSYAWEGIRAFR